MSAMPDLGIPGRKRSKISLIVSIGRRTASSSLYLSRSLTSAKAGLLKEHRGKYSYGHSFAKRFFKRHNLVSRVCTTKMRELPADFEDKKSKRHENWS